MESQHYFCTYREPLNPDYTKLGGVPKVKKLFTDELDVLLPLRLVFEVENICDTLVGFFSEYFGNC